MGSDFGGTIEFEYAGIGSDVKRDQIATMALEDWRSFIEDPEAALPWNTSIKVSVHEGTFESTVTIRWERVT